MKSERATPSSSEGSGTSNAIPVTPANRRAIEVLLVEDSESDMTMTSEALKKSEFPLHLSWVPDGVEAMEFLNRRGKYVDAPRPHLVLLDLHLPKKDGLEVLSEMNAEPQLKHISVFVLTTSEAKEHISKTYGLGGNCFLTKPVGSEQFVKDVKQATDLWFTIEKGRYECRR
jgi:two-component system, chemotaxis family, response regulator Rcp1